MYVGVDSQGRLNLEEMKEELSKGAALVSIMAVNNETGALFPICKVNEMKGEALLHVDAVQALGKENIKNLPGDLISVSGHKVHGPKGIGALYIRKGVTIPAFVTGGGQEKGRRSGTENLPGIVGLGLAAKLIEEEGEEDRKRIEECRDKLKAYILEGLEDVFINSPDDATPAILNISFPGTKGEVILHTLEQSGIMVSTGSACSSKKKGGSHVLKAMGLKDDRIESAIRFSFSKYNDPLDMEFVADKVKDAVTSFRRLGRFR